MKKLILIAALVPAFALAGSGAFAGDTLLPSSVSDVIDKAAKETTIDGEVGIQFRHEDRAEEDPLGEDDAGAGWSYAELEAESGSMWGLQVGVGAVAVQRLWISGAFDNDNPGDELFEDDVFLDNHDAYWTELYLKYTIPNSKTHFIVGRADDGKFGEPKSGDGDYYQGIGVTVGDIPRLKIRAHAVNEWTNDASPSWDFDGIQENWVHLYDEETYAGNPDEEASDVAFTLMLDAEILKDILSFSPYIQHHSGVGTSYGASLKAEYAFNSAAVGFEGHYARFSEDTPDEISADDEDMYQFTLNPYATFKKKGWKFEFGFGYYEMSDDIPPFNTYNEGGDDFEDVFIWDEFDPMEEDLAKYGEQQGNETWFVHGGFGWGPFFLEAIYGWCDDAVIEDGWQYDGEAEELDIYLTLNITKSIEMELVYCDIDDDYDASTTEPFGNDEPNGSFDHISGLICYKF